jgi:hypothetical protein
MQILDFLTFLLLLWDSPSPLLGLRHSFNPALLGLSKCSQAIPKSKLKKINTVSTENNSLRALYMSSVR